MRLPHHRKFSIFANLAPSLAGLLFVWAAALRVDRLAAALRRDDLVGCPQDQDAPRIPTLQYSGNLISAEHPV